MRNSITEWLSPLLKIVLWPVTVNCAVYNACKMSGRDQHEQVKRSKYVCEVEQVFGLKPISPVLEENVKDQPGKLINHDNERLRRYWQRDKEIIRYEAHVILLDHAEMKSFGMEREYCLARGVLWKPTVILVAQGTPLSVAQFEDDAVFTSLHAAAAYIQQMWGTPLKRVVWRIRVLNRSLPKWLWDQLYQFR